MYTISEEFKTWFRKFDDIEKMKQIKTKHRLIQEYFLKMNKHDANLKNHHDNGIRGRNGGKTSTLYAKSSIACDSYWQHLVEFKWMVSVL